MVIWVRIVSTATNSNKSHLVSFWTVVQSWRSHRCAAFCLARRLILWSWSLGESSSWRTGLLAFQPRIECNSFELAVHKPVQRSSSLVGSWHSPWWHPGDSGWSWPNLSDPWTSISGKTSLHLKPSWICQEYLMLDSHDHQVVQFIHAVLIEPHDGGMSQFVKHGSEHPSTVQGLMLHEYLFQELAIEHCACNVIQNWKLRRKHHELKLGLSFRVTFYTLGPFNLLCHESLVQDIHHFASKV